jgi:tRNA threonylcarbamoyladenosine biosynthesis protein TsaB
MKLLAIDTSTRFLALALYHDGRLYYYTQETGRKLSSLLCVIIERAIRSLGWGMGDIDYFACGLGPGSFTGLRIGLSTLKGFSWALKKPLIGIGTLDILAQGVGEDNCWVVPLVDAKRGLIYCSLFRKAQGRLVRKVPYKLLPFDECLKMIKPGSIIVGDALTSFERQLRTGIRAVKIFEKDYWFPSPQALVSLALEKIRRKEFADLFSVTPLYLYAQECQIKIRGK